MTEQSSSDTQEQAKHPGGRPLKYATLEDLDAAIQNYFAKCDPHTEQQTVVTGHDAKGNAIMEQRMVLTDQKPYTMSGLALALGISRKTLIEYSERDQFRNSLELAKQRCEEYAESQLYGPYANGAKFNLANNYRDKYEPWSDKQVLAGDPSAPLGNPMAPLTTEQLRKLADEQPAEATDGDTSADQA